MGSPANDIVWDGNHIAATVGRRQTAKIEGLGEEDGPLLLDLSAAGGGPGVRGAPARNEVLVTLPAG